MKLVILCKRLSEVLCTSNTVCSIGNLWQTRDIVFERKYNNPIYLVKIMNKPAIVKVLKGLGLGIVFVWFFVGGIGHFTSTDFFVAIVPPWVPFPVWTVYISGVFEIVLALLVLWPKVRPLAGWGLIALTVAVTPANIHMFMNPELFPQAPQSAYLIRLIVQIFLLLLIWWSTRIPRSSEVQP